MDTKPTASAQSRRKTRLFMIGAFLVAAAAFVVISAGGINKNLVYYWTPTDLHAAGDKAYGATIRLGGMVAPKSVRGRTGTSWLEFDVKDATGIVHVSRPAYRRRCSREHRRRRRRTMTLQYFQCNRLMVSHSNEYRAPKAVTR